MGMLHEMFGDEHSEISAPEGEFLAKGNYVSDKEKILKGYGVFRRKYVLMPLILRLLVAALAITSSVMMIINEPGASAPILCLMISVFVMIYFISTPIVNRKNTEKALESLNGTEYEAEFYTDKVKISTTKLESEIVEVSADENGELTEQAQEIPATIIHLDLPVVNVLDKTDIYILVVDKKYVFIIPKTAFSDEENGAIREKLSVIMGVRYKELD